MGELIQEARKFQQNWKLKYPIIFFFIQFALNILSFFFQIIAINVTKFKRTLLIKLWALGTLVRQVAISSVSNFLLPLPFLTLVAVEKIVRKICFLIL